MKTLLITLTFFFTAVFCPGQNLVPNPGFEEYNACPTQDGSVFNAKYWNSYGNSPDYFNSCSLIPDLSTPANAAGYQTPKSGQAYVGGAFFANNDTTNTIVREFIGVQLSSPLIVGKTYYVRFYVSLADSPSFRNIAQNRIGVWFSNKSYSVDSFCPPPCLISLLVPPNRAQVYTDAIIQDMENWVEVSGSFVADSNYQFLSIGDFFKNDSTDILILPNQPLYNNLGSYYYVDDVYVGEDEPNEIKEANERVIAIYPNPASEFVTLDYGFTNWTKGDIELQIVNSIGQTVYGQQLPSYSAFQKIDVSHFANGVYLVTIKKLGQLIANAKFVRE